MRIGERKMTTTIVMVVVTLLFPGVLGKFQKTSFRRSSPQQSIEDVIRNKNTGELRMGDAILQKSQVDMLYDDTHANSVIPDEKYRWTGGIIPYVIDCSLERLPDAMRSIKAAMEEWEAKTCIRFVKKTNEKKFLTFFRSTHCWCHVGAINGARLSVGAGCEFQHVMSHEIGHAVGFFHEHNRKDRNDYVEVLWQNIGQFTSAFEKTKNGIYHGTAYDMNSIMHYPWNAFSANGKNTLKPLKATTATPYKEVSALDIEQTSKMYKCPTLEKQREKQIKNAIFYERMAPDELIDFGYDDDSSYQKVDRLMKQTAMIGRMVAKAKVQPVGTKGCVDWSASCPGWKGVKYCETAPIVRRYCKLTCEVDGCKLPEKKPTRCQTEDAFPQCKDFAKDGLCCMKKYKAFMKEHCCPACFQPTTPTQAPTTTTTTTTTTTPKPKPKPKPVEPEDPEDPEDPEESGRFLGFGRLCVDLRRDCKQHAANGACTNKWASYMAKNCGKSCKDAGVEVRCDEQGLQPKGECTNPLGLASDGSGRFKIPDSSFSSEHGHLTPGGGWEAGPWNARLYMTDDYRRKRIGSWCSPTNDVTRSTLQMVTVDLGVAKRITYIATQGRDKYFERVSQFKVQYSNDNVNYQTYTEDGKEKVFQGNCDHVSPVLNHFAEPLEARYFRYIPWKWNYPCVRMELYGCGLDDIQPAPMVDSDAMFDSLTGSPAPGDLCDGGNPPTSTCKDKRQDKTWCPKHRDRCEGYSDSWTDYMKKYCERTCKFC